MTTTVTSSSPSPSPSDWLTRLRTSKGFPETHHTDLEHFLSTSLPQPQSPPPVPPKAPPADVTSPHPLPPHDVISNVLSDLFCFGQPKNNIPISRKTSRKQTNPKPCLFAKNPVLSSSPKVRTSKTSRKQIRPKVFVVAKDTSVEEVEVEDECGEDFTGFTETEVTVIDTSVVSWKFDKVLYRRKNVWRVGDVSKKRKERERGEDGKKCKKKKMKLCGKWKARDNESGNENGEKKKKKKKKKKLKFVNKEGDVAGSKSFQVHDQGKEMVAASEKQQDDCSQVHEKRVLKKQIDGGSSVILIKSIPLTTSNKKDMSGLSKSCVKLQK